MPVSGKLENLDPIEKELKTPMKFFQFEGDKYKKKAFVKILNQQLPHQI